MWRTMGARSEAEARGFLVARLRRSWGVAAARAAAHLRVARVGFVGMETRVAAEPAGRGGAAAGRGPVDAAVFMAGFDPAVDRRRV